MKFNKLFQANNLRDAAKTGILMMLQEENEVPIASEMALYSVYSYLTDEQAQDQVWDPLPEVVEPEPEEEVKIRVEELENPDFDDHFDLVKKEHLLGKTLAFIARGRKLQDSIIQQSLNLLGFVYFEKWSKVEKILNEKDAKFAKECLDLAANYANAAGNSIADQIQNAPSTQVHIKDILKSHVDSAIEKHQNKYIENQSKLYNEWNILRETELDNQRRKLLEADALQQIDQYKIKLREEEAKLFFFENYNQMEREKRIKYLEWRKYFPSRKGWGKQIKMGLRDRNVPLVTRKERQAAKKK